MIMKGLVILGHSIVRLSFDLLKLLNQPIKMNLSDYAGLAGESVSV